MCSCCPPLDMKERVCLPHVAYSSRIRDDHGARLRGEFRSRGIAARALAAHYHRDGGDQNLLGGDALMSAPRTRIPRRALT